MCHCACSVALTPCLWSSGVSESSVGHPPPTFMVSIQPRKMGVWVQETETPAWGWERRPEVRPEGWSSCSQLLRTGGVFSRKREPDARAVLTLGRRRTRVPLKRRRPADRGETRVRLSGPASSLPWSRAPVRVCLGAAGGWGGRWRGGSDLSKQIRECLPLFDVNSGPWPPQSPAPPTSLKKHGERR